MAEAKEKGEELSSAKISEAFFVEHIQFFLLFLCRQPDELNLLRCAAHSTEKCSYMKKADQCYFPKPQFFEKTFIKWFEIKGNSIY